jgi:predicted dehydrogenase
MKHASELGLNYEPKLPLNKHRIFIIGAGGIVKDAHLPAYVLAGFHVAGIFDVNNKVAQEVGTTFQIPVFETLESMIDAYDESVIFDIALPASAFPDVLTKLPFASSVLLQKPMGNSLEEAQVILAICRKKQLKAAVNFQLRYAPFMLAAKEIIRKGWIGEVCDVEFNINVFTPWHLWSFLYGLPRMEVLYHSCHYIDFIRNLLGNPLSVYGKTTKHPLSLELASVRSNIIMDYGDLVRASIYTNHNHHFGTKHQNSFVKIEGTQGAMKIQMGLLMNYPHGFADKFEFISLIENKKAEWQEVEIPGTWFPHAFIGSMAQLMCFVEGSSSILDNSVEDVLFTMKAIEDFYTKRY